MAFLRYWYHPESDCAWASREIPNDGLVSEISYEEYLRFGNLKGTKMPGMQGTFNANSVSPQQGTPSHPPGMFDFNITHTEIKPNKDNTGGYLEVEFTSPAGRTVFRYNLWNNSPQAVEIANKQLSALCHATGIFQLDFSNEAAALKGGRGRMEVGPQKNDPQYTEIKRVFDAQGNEPGRAPTAPAQQQQQGQQGGWGTAPANGQATSGQIAPAQPGWGAPAGQQQPAPQQQGGWQAPPNQAAPATQAPPNQPPWAK